MITVLYGDNIAASRDRMVKIVNAVKKRGWEVVRGEIVTTDSLFAKERLFVIEDISALAKKKIKADMRHLLFKLLVIFKLNSEDFAREEIRLMEYHSIAALEEDSLLTDGVLHTVYAYISMRVGEGFTYERAVDDLRRLLEESKRSFDSFRYYLEQRGVEAAEADFIESQQLSEAYMGNERPDFSWPSMRSQILNFISQLVMIEGWKYQLEVDKDEDTL